MSKKKIIIVGAGWFGLHVAILLQDRYDVTTLEKNPDIFSCSSNFNQNRLHLGYHYPRCSKTRNLCLKGYQKFINKYRNVVDFIDNNYYVISKNSNIDYDTYLQIFNTPSYNHSIVKNTLFDNIDGDIINTNEKIINPEKAKKYFHENIKCLLKFNYKVETIKQVRNKVIVNNDLECDLLFDCTYNMLNLSNQKYIFEKTISLIYKKINENYNFGAVTVMDGNFFSLFPRDIFKNLYSLTHVKYTPIIKTTNIKNIKLEQDISEKNLKNIISNMEKEVISVIPDFNKNFEYKNYFISYKCKIQSNNDNRSCIIEKDKNVIHVNCGKITGIFDFEDYVTNKLKLI